jgi:hypothetical protein
LQAGAGLATTGATMRRFPVEFADLLNVRGRRFSGPPADPFFADPGLIDPAKAKAAFALLERALGPVVKPMERAIPPESITGQTRNYQERLPKTVRVSTADIDAARTKAAAIAGDIGLTAMLRSESYIAFAAKLAGRPLDPAFGRQVLRYGPGDYAGPHTDHHPEEPRAKAGYFDLHLTFAGSGATRQLLVYAKDCHLTQTVDIAVAGGITGYRLPFWHYTTPLEGKEPKAARWVVLGTFLYA